MAECIVKPQGDQTLANRKLGQSCVLIFRQTENTVPRAELPGTCKVPAPLLLIDV